jgi:hypothetical protein
MRKLIVVLLAVTIIGNDSTFILTGDLSHGYTHKFKKAWPAEWPMPYCVAYPDDITVTNDREYVTFTATSSSKVYVLCQAFP